MKFSEIIEPPEGFTNTTNSYFLVLGIQAVPGPPSVPNPITSSDVGSTYRGYAGSLFDQNGNAVARMKNMRVQVYASQSSMTVWNGTTMETEPLTLYLLTTTYFERHDVLIPPQYTFKYFGVAIGFWLTFDEVKQYILKGASGENMMDFSGYGEV